MVTAGPRTRRRDEEERIILMKSRDRRALDFIRIILSFSSSPDFSTKNVRICDKYVSIWCHGGDHSKWSNCCWTWQKPSRLQGTWSLMKPRRAVPCEVELLQSWAAHRPASESCARCSLIIAHHRFAAQWNDFKRQRPGAWDTSPSSFDSKQTRCTQQPSTTNVMSDS